MTIISRYRLDRGECLKFKIHRNQFYQFPKDQRSLFYHKQTGVMQPNDQSRAKSPTMHFPMKFQCKFQTHCVHPLNVDDEHSWFLDLMCFNVPSSPQTALIALIFQSSAVFLIPDFMPIGFDIPLLSRFRSRQTNIQQNEIK